MEIEIITHYNLKYWLLLVNCVESEVICGNYMFFSLLFVAGISIVKTGGCRGCCYHFTAKVIFKKNIFFG